MSSLPWCLRFFQRFNYGSSRSQRWVHLAIASKTHRALDQDWLLCFFFHFILLLFSVYSKPEDYHVWSEWPRCDHQGHSLSLSEDACERWGPLCCRHECILSFTIFGALMRRNEIDVVEEMMKVLCPLTQVRAELSGKQSSSCPVPWVPATESFGGI